MISPDFCWIIGAAYTLPVRDSTTGPMYTTMAQVYKAARPATFTSLPCAGPEMAAWLRKLPEYEFAGYL